MRRPLVASGALGLLVIVSRLPLLGLGYGSDMDGWRLAATARAIRSTRAYSVSRFPGFPVHEIVSALLWAGGPYALNGATAAMSVAACVVFREILRKTGCGHSLLGGLALGFVPAVFIYSTCPMDYVWALSLALGSFHCLLVGRWIVAGILLGLAAGC